MLHQTSKPKLELQCEILVEGQVCASIEWSKRLGCDASEINRLVSLGVLRRSSGSGTDLQLDFVGVLATQNGTLFAAPKIFGQDGIELTDAQLFRIVRCIQRYQSRRRSGRVRETAVDEVFFEEAGSKLSIFLQLLAWTRDHGLHREDVTSLSEELEHVDWGDTFARGMTLHMRNGPVFSEYHGRKELGVSGKLAAAQSFALLRAYEELGLIGRLWLSRRDPIIEMCQLFLDNTDPSFLTQTQLRATILDSAHYETKDHDRQLIAILESWLDGFAKSSSKIQLFGTNAFHVVWEDICAVGLGSDGLSEHSKLASQGRYSIGSRQVDLTPQRPDHLFQDGSGVFVADAKWYRFWRNELPSLPDVVKQLMYEMTLQPGARVCANVFLLPGVGSDKLIEHLGSTAMVWSGKVDRRFPIIELFAIDWASLSDAYVANVGISDLRSKIAMEIAP